MHLIHVHGNRTELISRLAKGTLLPRRNGVMQVRIVGEWLITLVMGVG